MKAGIWGSGKIADTHMEALRSAGIEVEAVVGRRMESAERFARRWDIPVFGTDAELLLDRNIQSIHICTPPALHSDMIQFALHHQKHVLCEKPLCLSADQANQITQLAKEKQCIAAVNFNMRFHLACLQAREKVRHPDFGDILLIHGHYLQEFHALPALYGWRYHPAVAGHMLAVTEIGTHWLDLVQHISGQNITAVSAMFETQSPVRYLRQGRLYAEPGEEAEAEKIHVDMEDRAVVMLKFGRHTLGSLVLCEAAPGRINHLSFEITGAKQNIWWNSEENNALHAAEKGVGIHTEIFPFNGNGFTDTFRRLVQMYYASIKAGGIQSGSPLPSMEEGARLVQICEAIYQSAKQNSKWISIS